MIQLQGDGLVSNRIQAILSIQSDSPESYPFLFAMLQIYNDLRLRFWKESSFMEYQA